MRDTGRGRTRSRLRFGALALGLVLLAGCADHFGPGLVQLAAGRGWEPLPIRNWVVNEGITPKAMVFCPPQDCIRPGVTALISFEGREAAELERALALDPARLARAFARKAGAKAQGGKTQAKTPEASTTRVTRFNLDGAKGIQVDIRAKEGDRLASTAILYGRRDKATLDLAIAVTTESAAARDYARATWESR